MRSILFLIPFSILGLVVDQAAAGDSATAHTVEHLGSRFTVVTARNDSGSDIRMYGGTENGLAFTDAIDTAKRDGRQVIALMNGGMYDPSRRPVGLLVADGKQRQPLNARDGDGNFYMRPNGVFWTDGSRIAHVSTTDAFAADSQDVRYATQSGPMLVIDGAIPATFRPDSPNKLIRNGIGVSKDGLTTYLVISEGEVRFYDIAALFKDALACDDALYMDGVVSRLWTDGYVPEDRFGVVIAVTRERAH